MRGEKLQQDFVDIRMEPSRSGEQDCAIGTTALALGELWPLCLFPIARWRADQSGDPLSFHTYGDVDPDHRLLIAKHDWASAFARSSKMDFPDTPSDLEEATWQSADEPDPSSFCHPSWVSPTAG